MNIEVSSVILTASVTASGLTFIAYTTARTNIPSFSRTYLRAFLISTMDFLIAALLSLFISMGLDNDLILGISSVFFVLGLLSLMALVILIFQNV